MNVARILSIGLTLSLGWFFLSLATMILLLPGTALDRIFSLARLFLYLVAGIVLFLFLSKAVKNKAKRQLLTQALFIMAILNAVASLYLVYLSFTSVYALSHDLFVRITLIATVGNLVILIFTLLVALLNSRISRLG